MKSLPQRALLLVGVLVVLLLAPLSAAYSAAPINVTIAPAPSTPLAISYTGSSSDGSIERGDTVTLTLSIRNTGTGTITPHLYPAEAPTGLSAVTDSTSLPDSLRSVALPAQSERVDPQIATDLANDPQGTTRFLVLLEEQADLTAAYSIRDWHERGQYVYDTLTQHAAASQRDLRAYLTQQQLPFQPLWLVNGVLVEGDTSDVQALAARSEVAMLRASHTASLPPLDAAAVAAPAAFAFDTTWNLDQIAAPRTWDEFGVTGAGITVGVIDSGVGYTHPALQPSYRGYRAPATFDHNYNWHDPAGTTLEPLDTNTPGHGTHVTGTIVGRAVSNGTTTEPAVGVAPEAQWVAAVGCKGVTCWESDLIAAAQWMLAPTDLKGENPRPDLRPHIINNSWASSPDNDFYTAYTAAWQAAGIFPVFVAGNDYTLKCSTVKSPGDYSDVLTVGATNSEDSRTPFSALGPAANGNLKPDLMAPGEGIYSTYANGRQYGMSNGTSMAAPHVAGAVALLWSANPTLIGDYAATYDVLTTSATPLTDAAYSEAPYTQCNAETVPNNVYGYGRLDVYRAVANARVAIPWLTVPTTTAAIAPGASTTATLTLDTNKVPAAGTYTARVLVGTGDLSQTPATVTLSVQVSEAANAAPVTVTVQATETGQGVAGAVVIDDNLRVTLADDGTANLTLPVRAEPYTIATDVSGYEPSTQTITVSDTAPQTLAFTLIAEQSQLTISDLRAPGGDSIDPFVASVAHTRTVTYTMEIENTGSQPLTFRMSTPPHRYGAWRSDTPDAPVTIAPQWEDGTANLASLSLTDNATTDAIPLGFAFPFYDAVYETVYISANGVLSFQPLVPGEPGEYTESCFPIAETSTTAIVPLRADFNPANGGKVTYGSTADKFIVTFEDVPVNGVGTPPRYTFQVVLHRDGRISYNYQRIGALTAQLAAGVQNNVAEGQRLGCGTTIPISSGLTVELRPQNASLDWLNVPDRNQSIGIAAGATRSFPVEITWVYSPGTYERAELVLTNQDSRQPPVTVPIYVQPQQVNATHLPVIQSQP